MNYSILVTLELTAYGITKEQLMQDADYPVGNFRTCEQENRMGDNRPMVGGDICYDPWGESWRTGYFLFCRQQDLENCLKIAYEGPQIIGSRDESSSATTVQGSEQP